MNKKDLFSIALRFTSLLLLITCFQNIILLILELTSPTLRQMSLFGLSPYGYFIRFLSIILYGLTGYFLFKKSDYISLKLIKNNGDITIPRETVLQMVIAYQGVSGILYSLINIVLSFIKLLPILDISNFADISSTLFARLGVYLITFIISIALLLNYEKITRFLLRFIPNRLWGK